MLIREVILENFMSYEYARIPLKSGVNIACGPNGSGKSSILLGISVALGQSYTERSKKLSDLIRWGKDQARVTVVLDNTRKKGRRPAPRINKDSIFLTRMFRRDGKYWFELENKAANKKRVERLLSKLGVDPNNMLVIMHQNMVEQFTVLQPQEKLKIVEAAVGFESYRQNVSKAQRKLKRILSQEESVGKLLESAQQTLSYWREQHDRYQQKKQLRMKRKFLEREFAWAEVSKREKTVTELKSEVREKQSEISHIKKETEITRNQLRKLQTRLKQSKTERQNLIQGRLKLEYERAKHETGVSLVNQTLEKTRSWSEIQQEYSQDCLNQITRLETTFQRIQNPIDTRAQFAELKETYENLGNTWAQQLNLRSEGLKGSIEDSYEQLEKLHTQIADVEAKMNHLNSESEDTNEGLIYCRINLALLKYQKENAAKTLKTTEKQLQTSLASLHEAVEKAKETGPQIASTKDVAEILDEIRLTDGHLAALADVSEDIERMYESYSKLYLDLKEKAQLVAESREKALEEVGTRMTAWRMVIQDLLKHVSLRYNGILSQTQAIGAVKLVNEQDIEEAGLEILVGFKGGKLVPLNSYTQSGGERSTATISFLLALQQHVRSRFRAVDEYDIHMDPRNREIIANLLVSSIKGRDAQYLAITPSQMTFTGKDVHIITVQNVEGTSLIREVA
ncbi:MAG: AAA family ATPase [Candidatus Bathyarchaeota archaeon]|nr:MAG: AAA family ATPase [Candidatus Bathyarchaeota archaeon]